MAKRRRLELTRQGLLRAKQHAPQHAVSEELFRPTADGRGLGLTPQGLGNLTSGIVLSPSPQRERDRRFTDAEREQVLRVEALAQKTLQANPFSEGAGEEEEEKWRELADASRQLRPLLDALAKADEPNSEYAKYRRNFQFRLSEAMATITELVEYERQRLIRARKDGSLGGRPRKAPQADAFDNLVLECVSNLRRRLGREPTAPEVWKEMVSLINGSLAGPSLFLEEKGAKIELCDDKRVLRSIARTSFREIFSRLRRMPSTEPGFR